MLTPFPSRASLNPSKAEGAEYILQVGSLLREIVCAGVDGCQGYLLRLFLGLRLHRNHALGAEHPGHASVLPKVTPAAVEALRTSEAVRLRLSVKAWSMMAAPPGP